MRISLVIYLLISIGYQINSQEYRPMAVEGATWLMAGWGDFESIKFGYKIKGDTTINSTVYKKIQYLDIENSFDDEFFLIDEYYIGYMRDDTISKKIYGNLTGAYNSEQRCYDDVDSQELLFYDFELDEDDLMFFCGYRDSTYTISSIIEYPIYNDTFKVFSYSKDITSFNDLNLIEGVGSYKGLFNAHGELITAGEGYSLVDYCLGTYWECNVLTSSHDVIVDNAINIYPNPAIDQINIESEEEIKFIKIFNLNAQLVFTSTGKEIDVSSLNPGIYILQLYIADDRLLVEKLIVR